jgi:hypothetical protein
MRIGEGKSYLGRGAEYLELRRWHNAATDGATVASNLNVV